MKCSACHYEFEEELIHENKTRFYKTIIGDEEFILIEGHFTTVKKYDYRPNERETVNLYACPKCGIVKLNQ